MKVMEKYWGKMEMKAARWYARHDVRVEDLKEVEATKDFVKIKVGYTGICGSDLHEYDEGPVFIPENEPNEFTGQKAPITMGHEFAGEVVEVGPDVKQLKIGDRVAVYPPIAHESHPEDIDLYFGYNFIGLAQNGGLAEFCTVKESAAYKLPEGMDTKHGALVEPTAVAVQAVKEGGVKFGDKVAIFGAGPIGALVAAAAKAAGATEIIVCDLSEQRLEKAKELGATTTINSKEVHAVAKIKEITNGGVDVSFEVAGVSITFEQAIAAVRPRGFMVVVSIFARPITWNPLQLTDAGVKITSTIAYTRTTFAQTIEAISNGQLNVDPIITKEIKLDNIVEDGFKTLVADKSQSKILVNINSDIA